MFPAESQPGGPGALPQEGLSLQELPELGARAAERGFPSGLVGHRCISSTLYYQYCVTPFTHGFSILFAALQSH